LKIIGSIAAVAALTITAIVLYTQIGSSADATGIDRILTKTATRTPRGGPVPTATATPSAPPRPSTYPAADGPGILTAECAGGGQNSVRVFLLWNASTAGTQYLDFSIFNNGFQTGTFLSVGPLAHDRWGYILDGVRQGTSHTARINTWTGSAWAPSTPLQFFTPVCDPAAAERAASADMIALQTRMGGTVYASGINAAIAITDLQTGETIDVNGFDVRLPGCTLNLFAIMATVQTLQAGRYPEPEAGDLIGQTINRSDPITARRLMRYWVGDGDLVRGIERTNTLMAALGMNDTLMDHPPAFPEESLFGGINNRITARDSNRGLKALWDGQVVAPGWRDYLLQKMTLVKPGLQYIIGSAGYEATQSHKNGFLWEQGWADNDIGIVWYQRGAQRYGYAISFFSQYLKGKYDAIPLAQQLAAQAYDWFVSRYGYP
jgi:hypothetical protein